MTSDSFYVGNNAYLKENELSEVEEITMDMQEAESSFNGLQERLDWLRSSYRESVNQISPPAKYPYPTATDIFMSGQAT